MAKVYAESKIMEYTGTLPITIKANGSALADHRVYGSAGGVGDRTEQLFNAETAVYKVGYYKNDSGAEAMYPGAGYYETYMPITPNETIHVINVDGTENLTVRLYFYNAQKQWILRTDGYVNDFSVVAPSNAAYAQLQISPQFIPSPNTITITQDSATSYIPYGYVVPISVSDGTTSTTTPIYIGDTPLGEDEYISYSEQKIYRMSGGTLTPTDPPVPLPQLPTCDGTTITDYAGQSAAPSQMYIKYNSFSGWEPCGEYVRRNGVWVPCTEYIRRNGVWVPQT